MKRTEDNLRDIWDHIKHNNIWIIEVSGEEERKKAYKFVIYSFYYVEVCSFYSCFLESFNHKWMLNFVKGFFCIYWDNHMVFIFQFVNVVYHIDWFVDINESLHSWYKAHLVMVYDFFSMLLDSVC